MSGDNYKSGAGGLNESGQEPAPLLFVPGFKMMKFGQGPQDPEQTAEEVAEILKQNIKELIDRLAANNEYDKAALIVIQSNLRQWKMAYEASAPISVSFLKDDVLENVKEGQGAEGGFGLIEKYLAELEGLDPDGLEDKEERKRIKKLNPKELLPLKPEEIEERKRLKGIILAGLQKINAHLPNLQMDTQMVLLLGRADKMRIDHGARSVNLDPSDFEGNERFGEKVIEPLQEKSILLLKKFIQNDDKAGVLKELGDLVIDSELKVKQEYPEDDRSDSGMGSSPTLF